MFHTSDKGSHSCISLKCKVDKACVPAYVGGQNGGEDVKRFH